MALLNAHIPMFNEGSSDLVTSSGTSLTAFSAVAGNLFILQADHSNTSLMTIVFTGGSSGSTDGIKLAPGEMQYFYVPNLALLSYKAGTSGDKIRYIAFR